MTSAKLSSNEKEKDFEHLICKRMNIILMEPKEIREAGMEGGLHAQGPRPGSLVG